MTMFYLYKRYHETWTKGKFVGIILIAGMAWRFFTEFFKENQVAFEEGIAMNMGQILSVAMMFIFQAVYFFAGMRFCFYCLWVFEVGRNHHNAATYFFWAAIPKIKLIKSGVVDYDKFRIRIPGQPTSQRPVAATIRPTMAAGPTPSYAVWTPARPAIRSWSTQPSWAGAGLGPLRPFSHSPSMPAAS